MSIPVTIWRPSDGLSESVTFTPNDIVDPDGNYLVDPSGNQITDTGLRMDRIPATVWSEDE